MSNNYQAILANTFQREVMYDIVEAIRQMVDGTFEEPNEDCPTCCIPSVDDYYLKQHFKSLLLSQLPDAVVNIYGNCEKAIIHYRNIFFSFHYSPNIIYFNGEDYHYFYIKPHDNENEAINHLN